MKKTNKKGFTIVELVIVIAVIAILAAVLIPTFSNVVEKAKESNALTASRNAYTMLLAEANADLTTLVTSGDSVTINSTDTTDTGKVLADAGVSKVVITKSSGDAVFTVGDYTVTFDADATTDAARWTVAKVTA